MENKKISPERWQALYGPVPQDFDLLVQRTLNKTKEAPAMKRFTLRTVLLIILSLLLLMGIALAATGVFGTVNYLKVYTSPTNGTEIDIQTDLHQTGGDFPDLTVTVRDAVFDGVTAYVTVEYKLKNPEKDMILSHWNTDFAIKDVGRWPGYSTVPLTDPKTDPRRKLVVSENDVRVEGAINHVIADYIYEKEGVLVLTWRIRLDSTLLYDFPQESAFVSNNDALPIEPVATENAPEGEMATSEYYQTASTSEPFDKEFSWEKQVLSEPTPMPDSIQQWMAHISTIDTLDLRLNSKLGLWEGIAKDWTNDSLYDMNVGITLKKTDTPIRRKSALLVSDSDMTLTNVMITFTKLATYMDISCEYPLGMGTVPNENANPYDNMLFSGLAFDLLDDKGNVIPRLGESYGGVMDAGLLGDRVVERNRYGAFWPAMGKIPATINLRAYSYVTKEYLATFSIPLVPVPSASPNP